MKALACCLLVGASAALLPPAPSPAAPTSQPESSRAGPPDAGHSPGAAPQFELAEECALCHSASERSSALRDARGRIVAPYDLWRGTMMAHASKDPLFRAQMAVEVASFPEGTRRAVESECMRCHAPLGYTEAIDREEPADARLLDPEHRLYWLAMDGVSCTLCHQIVPDNFGEPSSFSGHYLLNDDGLEYGPHAGPFANPMIAHVGFVPTYGPHITVSGHCATCHTLFTNTLDEDGEPTGHRLAEQVPYLEWRASAFSTERDAPSAIARDCQGCHVPTTDVDGQPIRTRIARNPRGGDFPPLEERAPVGRHVFVGGNTLVPAILRDHGEELGVDAPAEALDAVLAATREQLETRTARVRIAALERVGGRLQVTVSVQNLAGHKVPTGQPIRRAWLRFEARDAAGKALFASGRHDARGVLLDGVGEVLPSERPGGPIQPHRQIIDDPAQVQIYESVMGDPTGKPTFRLMGGARYLKDNRLLPRGWDPLPEDAPHIRPVGPEEEEADFRGGFDRVLYAFAVPEGTKEVHVEVALLYQTLGSRARAELLRHELPAVQRLAGYLKDRDLRPVPLARELGVFLLED